MGRIDLTCGFNLWPWLRPWMATQWRGISWSWFLAVAHSKTVKAAQILMCIVIFYWVAVLRVIWICRLGATIDSMLDFGLLTDWHRLHQSAT